MDRGQILEWNLSLYIIETKLFLFMVCYFVVLDYNFELYALKAIFIYEYTTGLSRNTTSLQTSHEDAFL